MKYNKSSIMKAAWEIIRTTGATIREAMKAAWRMARIDRLVAAGARRWTKGSMDRLYINADVLGYEYERYNTGNIRYAEYNGERISNSEMGRVLSAKTYIDCSDMKVHGTYSTVTNQAREWIAAII